MGAGPHGTFVKICGITIVADAQAAVRAGANAIGFVFAPSPRRVSYHRASKIAAHVHPSVWKFAVFVDPDAEAVRAAVEQVGVDAVQLQGAESPGAVAGIRKAFPRLFVAKVIRATGPDALEAAASFPADAIFFDPKDPARPAERNRPVPVAWLAKAAPARLVVSGGLTPRNVGRLVREVRPWGVDVSGGVEEAPGRKDHEKVRAFVRAVRRAEATA